MEFAVTRFLRRLRLTLEMIKFEHSVFALPFALTGALLACGGWVLTHKQEKGVAALDFELARAACVEVYAVLIGCGLELSRDPHLKMAELCHCTKNLIETRAFDIARIDLVVYNNRSQNTGDDPSMMLPG